VNHATETKSPASPTARSGRGGDGGRAQRFCRPTCRRAFHAAARAWARDKLAAGRVTVGDFKNGLHATRASVPAAFSGSPLPGHPLSAVPQAPTDEAAQQEAPRAIPDKNLRPKKSARCRKSRKSRQAHPSEIAAILEAGAPGLRARAS
jgi:hypothetical protein